ncbi:MAG: anaerobic ribonucleoside-triphosphate reductase, partial [Nitrosopumilus sp.]
MKSSKEELELDLDPNLDTDIDEDIDDSDIDADLESDMDGDSDPKRGGILQSTSKRVRMIFSVMASPNRIDILRILN